MNSRVTLGISALLFACVSWAQCSKSPQPHRRLQWSEATQATSPNFRWQVVLRPVLTSEENNSPVLLKSCRGRESWQLLTLSRSAEVFWAPSGSRLLVINQPTADVYQLLLFDVEKLSSDSATQSANEIDEVVKQSLKEKLRESRIIEFYLPTFVSWANERLVLGVGGATSSGRDGPMQSYCYGFVIDSTNRRMQNVLSRKDLKAKFGAQCKESP